MEVSWILSGGIFAQEKADWSATLRGTFLQRTHQSLAGSCRSSRSSAACKSRAPRCRLRGSSDKHKRREEHETARERGREESEQCAGAVRHQEIRVLFSGAKDTKNGITQEKWTENSSGKADWSATLRGTFLQRTHQSLAGRSGSPRLSAACTSRAP